MGSSLEASVLIPALLGIGTAAVGVWQFSEAQRQANRRPFLEQQLALCFEICDIVAVLATDSDRGRWEAARRDFWRLYWGKLGIVESAAIESAMVRVGEIVPVLHESVAQIPLTALRVPSLQLAHAARELILKSWGVEMEALRARAYEEG